MDEEAAKLLATAQQTLDEYYEEGKHHVACALLCSNGKIYKGIHLDCAGYDTCAEPVAIAQALLAKEQNLALIAACMKNPRTGELRVINPCGNCLQHFMIYAPDIEIVTHTIKGLQRLPLSALFPYPYVPEA